MNETAKCILAKLRKDAETFRRFPPWREWLRAPMDQLRCLVRGHRLQPSSFKLTVHNVFDLDFDAMRFLFRCRCGMRASIAVSPELLRDAI